METWIPLPAALPQRPLQLSKVIQRKSDSFCSWSRPSRICTLSTLLLAKRQVYSARKCMAPVETFEDAEGIDDTDDSAAEQERRSFETCVGSYAWLYEAQDFDWRSLAGRRERAPKTTVALIIGYLGHNFLGLQQPCFRGTQFAHAVETELELALLKAGAMIPENFGNLCRLRWSRVGRTDAGVSASCNVVTGRLIVEKDDQALDDLVDRIREFLPRDLAIHGAAFVSKRFSARWEGTRREYLFLLPSFCVAPTLTMTRTWLAKNRPGEAPTDFSVEDLQKLEDALGLRKIRLSSEHLKCFRLALASFEGTHFFGNFANKKLDPRGPQGFRHVRRVHCGNPWVDEHGREWVTVEICADSFLTHQIRKMIATAALVAQGALSLEFIDAAMHRHLDVKTQRFPPNGLIFKRPFFKSKTSTGLPSSVEAKLNSEEVAARMFAMQEWLQKEVIKEAEEGLSAVYWLACVAHFEPEDMESEVLQQYRRLMPKNEQHIKARQAASTQVACIVASQGAELWLGRHRRAK
ncbi:unnamed protein product [Durusdinium trenchii]|uniref:Pseudouridine synthase I TruA alpha/beta domain-containing protein n=1 Tax=Durusdinium trenchii TaxID=1381693 RepID=A0ABP0MIR7_9DINO